MMGADRGSAVFEVVEITVQRRLGTFSGFMRVVAGIFTRLQRFLDRTGHRYREYNYLGEWHSHPSFSVEPSITDVESMVEIVTDTAVGANFAVLLIVRLRDTDTVEFGGYAFLKKGTMEQLEVTCSDR